MSGLTEFQSEVARLFFALPASDGFLLAGGGAVLACGLITRPTEDLDFFGERGRSDVAAARDQFETAVAEQGWDVVRVQDSRRVRPAAPQRRRGTVGRHRDRRRR